MSKAAKDLVILSLLFGIGVAASSFGQSTGVSRWTPPQSHGVPPAEDCTATNPGEQVWHYDKPGVFWICAPFDSRWVEFKVFETTPREPRIDADDPSDPLIDPPVDPPESPLDDGRESG